MLPDLPELKSDIQHEIDLLLHRMVYQRMGAFADVPRHFIHEGDCMQTVRADGSVDTTELKRATAEISIALGEIPSMSLQERLRKLEAIADEMANQISKHLFETLNDTLDRAGQVVNRHDSPFDAETVLAAVSSIEVEFDETGKHSPLTLVVPPSLGEAVQRAFRQIDSDPSLKARYDEIMKEKLERWRDREAARKLVG